MLYPGGNVWGEPDRGGGDVARTTRIYMGEWFSDPSAAKVERCTSVSAKLSTSDSPAVHQDGMEYVVCRVPARIVERLHSMADLACLLLKRTAVSRLVFS